MIEPDKRDAIILLHTHGMTIKEIAKKLKISKNTVRDIIRNPRENKQKTRSDKIQIDSDLLRKLFHDCDGWIQRVHEKLTEEGKKVAYSTLTQRLRELGIGVSQQKRCGQFPDEPGREMQYDTSPYRLTVGNTSINVVGSSIYFRYSKVRYLKFYRFFRRFEMKCFFYEALSFFKYVGIDCVIDNTNLAVLEGTGKNALFVPEMIALAENFGFKWLAHEKGHSNRKAGEERSFWTVETNFFPGRKFASMEDLNDQAFIWSTQTIGARPHSKTRLIPIELFEQEKPFLKKIPPFIQPPYLRHDRGTDQYGYIQFEANYYWVPGTSLKDVVVLQFATKIRIYQHRSLLIEYPLPPFGTRNEKIKPPGLPDSPYQPRHRSGAFQEEEKKLRALAPEVNSFIEFITTQPGGIQAKIHLLRRLESLHRAISLPFFIKTIERALRYRVTDASTIERIATQLVKQEAYQLPLYDSPDDFEERESYQEGKISDEPDLSRFDEVLNQEELEKDQNQGGEDDGKGT